MRRLKPGHISTASREQAKATEMEAHCFRAIGASGARALLIGRRALVALGIPLLIVDYERPKDLEDIRLLEALRKEEA